MVSESKCFMNRVTSCDFCSCHVGENKLCASRGDRERYIFPFYAYLLFNCRISLAHLVLHRPRSESFVTVQKLDREADFFDLVERAGRSNAQELTIISSQKVAELLLGKRRHLQAFFGADRNRGHNIFFVVQGRRKGEDAR